MRKPITILLLVFLMVVPVFAQGAKEQKQEDNGVIELTWTNWGQAFDALKPAFDAMGNGFTAKNSNVKINQIGIPYNQFKDQLLVMSTAGNAPDISMIKAEWVSSFVEAGVLQPLDEVLSKETLNDFYPGLLAGGTYDGKVMSIPWAPSPICIYYNKTLLKKAGFDNPPSTWSELMDQAYAVSKIGTEESKIYGIGFAGKKIPGAGYFFLINMMAHNGKLIDEKGNIVIDSPENLIALQELKNATDNGVSPAGLELNDLRDLFGHERIAFHFDLEAAGGIFQGLNPKGKAFTDDYGIIVVPGPTGSKGKSIAIEHHLVMFKDSKNKEISAKLLDYLTGPEGIAVYNANNGYKLPARKTVAKIPFYETEESKFMEVFIQALDTAQGLPCQSVAFLEACEEIADAIQRVSLNNEEPADVLKKLDAKVKKLYQE
jgi:multiple sugar transport system substrate-binding protein